MFAAKNELFTTPSGYQIQRSLRFRSSASAYLNRTQGAGNRRIFTLSTWVKRGSLGSYNPLFTGQNDLANSDWDTLEFNSSDVLRFYLNGAASGFFVTTQVFRDPSAWYHIVLAVDTTQATSTNRVKIYVNGLQITNFTTATYPSQNFDCWINKSGRVAALGANYYGAPTGYFDGYLTEVNFIDGQALTPSSFGAINAVTGVWSATRYNGTYGTNGFYLNFTDNSAATAATIGKDYSGNGNNWTPNNISVTAGATYDSMLDAPLGAGGGERGNYCVLNPLRYYYANGLSNGNLTITNPATTDHYANTGTVALSGSTSKFYAEMLVVTSCVGSTVAAGFGFANDATLSYATDTGNYIIYSNNNNGKIFSNGVSLAANIASIVAGANDIYQIAFDSSTGNAWVGKNNTWYNNTGGTTGDPATGANPTFTLTGQNFYPYADAFNNTVQANFGQRPFSYTPPTGFKALHTGNLAAPVIALPAQNMAATLYTGNGSTQTVSNAVNGVSFQPDLVWVKGRSSSAQDHLWVDSVRGISRRILSNTTAAEVFESGFNITAFNSSGFTAVDDTNGSYNVNGSVGGTFSGAAAYVGWQWKAGGTAVTNTAGSITSSVSANTTAGFSVVTYTGNNTGGATVGHGLGVVPSMVIVKQRSGVNDWWVAHSGIPSAWIQLSSTGASGTGGGSNGSINYQSTFTSSVFGFIAGSSSSNNINASGGTYVAYCFAPVAGYSAFGSYTGNGSADGPFVFLGFRPRFVMIKASSLAGESWYVVDATRSPYNAAILYLVPNSSGAEGSPGAGQFFDFLSNGFKLRVSGSYSNSSSETYIYMAFAENPFKYANAR